MESRLGRPDMLGAVGRFVVSLKKATRR